MKQHIKRAFQIALVPLVAALVFLEQTLIRCLNMVTTAIAAWPPIAKLESQLVRLPPYWALLTFVTPSLLILPIKLSAFWFGVHHRYGLALGSVIVGKLLATAILAMVVISSRSPVAPQSTYAKRTLPIHSMGPINAASLTADGKAALYGTSSGLWRYDLETGALSQPIARVGDGEVSFVEALPDGSFVLSTRSDREQRIELAYPKTWPQFSLQKPSDLFVMSGAGAAAPSAPADAIDRISKVGPVMPRRIRSPARTGAEPSTAESFTSVLLL